jgi:4-diphosphocytidyl-2-C-methyl-D-erythritol kinase
VPVSDDHPLAAFAPAKVNLTLRVLGRRRDGYHDIDSLVVFADVGDRVSFVSGAELGLVVGGPSATASGDPADNLVLKAARSLAARVEGIAVGQFHLDKRLPVAAGLGGGSSDAAAALRLLARVNGISADDPRLGDAAAATGADVPVCLDPQPRVMRGIGEILSQPLDCPKLPAVLVNPRVALATADVFAALGLAQGERRTIEEIDSASIPGRRDEFIDLLRRQANDLESPAIQLQPIVADVLTALRAMSDCRLARMSGSGATCFALFDGMRAAHAAVRQLRAAHSGWWIRATTLGAAEARPQQSRHDARA